MRAVIDPEEIRAYLKTVGANSRIYIGADSEKMKISGVWYADYMLAVVVHIEHEGTFRGCRIFGEIQRERDYDAKKDKPTMRLMNECYKVAELAERLHDVVDGYEVEIHLDLNPNKRYVSNHVAAQAIGYIKGTVGIDPKIKPEAFSASYAADQLKNVLASQARKVAAHV